MLLRTRRPTEDLVGAYGHVVDAPADAIGFARVALERSGGHDEVRAVSVLESRLHEHGPG